MTTASPGAPPHPTRPVQRVHSLRPGVPGAPQLADPGAVVCLAYAVRAARRPAVWLVTAGGCSSQAYQPQRREQLPLSLFDRGARAAAIALLRLRAAVQPRPVKRASTTDTERSSGTTPIDAEGPWLDPERPRVAYIFRLPFDLAVDTQALGLRVVIPLGDEQLPALVQVAHVAAPRLLSDAALRYLCRIRGQEDPELQPELVDEWVAEVELNNALVEGRTGWSPGELLFEHALETFNRYLHAYMVATEISSIRFLTAQALDPLAIVEFRLADGAPLEAGPFILPAAHRASSLDPSVVSSRLQHAVRAEGYGHPIDDVILWRLRAEHLLNYVGDYELSLLALQTSGRATGVRPR